MKTDTEILAAVEAAAIARATSLCDAALAFLSAGNKTFVKGKPVIVPWSEEKVARSRSLQESAFTKIDGAAEMALKHAVDGADVSEELEAEIVATWERAGLAEVAKRFG